ncbi:MAG: hypothetical protein ACR2HM_00450 [Acidimicrobiales bacterium]
MDLAGHSLRAGLVTSAAAAIDEGRAAGVLDRLVRVSNEQAAASTG